MPREITPEQRRKLDAGRRRAQAQARRAAVRRVDAYKRWVRDQSKPIPEIPSKRDYAIWNETKGKA